MPLVRRLVQAETTCSFGVHKNKHLMYVPPEEIEPNDEIVRLTDGAVTDTMAKDVRRLHPKEYDEDGVYQGPMPGGEIEAEGEEGEEEPPEEKGEGKPPEKRSSKKGRRR